MKLNHARSLSVAAAGLVLAVAGCKTTPCHPPSCMAEPAEVATAAPCQPPPTCQTPATRYVAPVGPAAPVMAAVPKADPDAQARIDVLRTSVEAQDRRNAEMEAKRGPVAAARPGAPMASGAAEESARRLAEELKSVPGTQVLVEGGSAVAVVTDSFASGSDKLKTSPDVHAALRAISMAMSRHPEARVTVTGHTDSTPIKASKWSDNEALSKARAEVVANALATDGVGRDRMKVDGMGPKNPMVAPEKTASDRARNRRVEVEFAFGK
jgi:outer membrane protein OmpA-like peptidoglycan-associated protein